MRTVAASSQSVPNTLAGHPDPFPGTAGRGGGGGQPPGEVAWPRRPRSCAELGPAASRLGTQLPAPRWGEHSAGRHHPDVRQDTGDTAAAAAGWPLTAERARAGSRLLLTQGSGHTETPGCSLGTAAGKPGAGGTVTCAPEGRSGLRWRSQWGRLLGPRGCPPAPPRERALPAGHGCCCPGSGDTGVTPSPPLPSAPCPPPRSPRTLRVRRA